MAATTRWCVICDEALDGDQAERAHRKHALTCSAECRAERSRLLRILSGVGADGRRSLAEHHARSRKRTQAA